MSSMQNPAGAAQSFEAPASFGSDMTFRLAELKKLGAVQHFAGLDPSSAAILGKLLLGETEKAAAVSAEGKVGELLVGSEVVVHSLQSASGSAFNGLRGTVTGFSGEERVHIDFGPGVGVKALRTQNLRRVVGESASERPAPRAAPIHVGEEVETRGGELTSGEGG